MSTRLPLLILSAWMTLALGAGCSGSVDPVKGDGDGDANGDGDGDGAPSGDGDNPPGGDGDGTRVGCVVDGVVHLPGETVSTDGCNSCSCQAGGQIGCTTQVCGDGDGDVPPPPPSATCEVDGVVYQSGDVFASDCNTCTCSDEGISCTLIYCGEPPDAECNSPFDGGDCDAAMPVYWHNPATGLCEPETYGGCGGNENRFESLEQCMEACGGAAPGQSCEVNGVVYSDGAMNVPDPTSCNTCRCTDGEVTACTEIYCPTECPEGTALGSQCTACGPVDECLSVMTGCFPTCENSEDCATTGGECSSGLCKINRCV